jgi:hypothetical protein
MIYCVEKMYLIRFGRKNNYNRERRVANIQSAARRRLEGKGRSRIAAATPAHTRPATAASQPQLDDNGCEEEIVRLAQSKDILMNNSDTLRSAIFRRAKLLLQAISQLGSGIRAR